MDKISLFKQKYRIPTKYVFDFKLWDYNIKYKDWSLGHHR